MNAIELILREISNGRKSFIPVDSTQESMEDFQSIAKLLIYCEKQSWLDSIKPKKESRSGNDWYETVPVLGDLTYEGEQYLESLASKNTNSENSPKEDIIELKPNFMGIGINLNALIRWRKTKNKQNQKLEPTVKTSVE
ncbi:hypothetical protein EGM51_13995 [Verrucomicrobia bacterium S94]|nr:hypothetical protein EGM51_13995 [Verrucomicrobia bacterium S94]